MIALMRRAVIAGVALGLVMGGPMTTDSRADSVPAGKAEGTLTVNGKTINVTYAYALSAPGFADPNTPDVKVILSDVPLDAAALADDLARVQLAQQGKLHAFEITIDASGTPISTAWRHNGFQGGMPSGLSSDDVFTKTVFDGKVVEGSYKSGPNDEFFDDKYSFDVSFHAEIAH